MIRAVIISLFFFFATFISTTVAMAQVDTPLSELVAPLYEAVVQGNYTLAAAFGLVLLVALVRRYGGSRYPILAHRLVAPLLVLLGSVAAAVATTVGAGGTLGVATLYAALKVAIGAGGTYAMLKPYIEALASKAPAWTSPLFAILAAIFKSRAAARVAASKAAGKAAVEAAPSQGAAVDFRDFP